MQTDASGMKLKSLNETYKLLYWKVHCGSMVLFHKAKSLSSFTYHSGVLSVRPGLGWGKNKAPKGMAMLGSSFARPRGVQTLFWDLPRIWCRPQRVNTLQDQDINIWNAVLISTYLSS